MLTACGPLPNAPDASLHPRWFPTGLLFTPPETRFTGIKKVAKRFVSYEIMCEHKNFAQIVRFLDFHQFFPPTTGACCGTRKPPAGAESMLPAGCWPRTPAAAKQAPAGEAAGSAGPPANESGGQIASGPQGGAGDERQAAGESPAALILRRNPGCDGRDRHPLLLLQP